MPEPQAKLELAAVKAEIRREIDDLTGVLQKATNSLLIAHGGAILGCLSQVKDYTPDSKLKGIGIFIAAFVAGFIMAAIAYIDVALGRTKMLLGLFKNDVTEFQPKELRRGSTLLYISTAILLLAVLGIAWRFIWL